MQTKKIYISLLVFNIWMSIAFSASPSAYIHTDRYCYASGDIAFVKIYLPAYLNCNCKQTVFLDILSPRGSFLYGELLKMNSGLASGYLPIQDSLQTGYYTIRAYTEESKTAKNKILANRKIYIANRFAGNEKVYENVTYKSEKNHTPGTPTKKCVLKPEKNVYSTREPVLFTAVNTSDNMLYASITVKPDYKLEEELELSNTSVNQLVKGTADLHTNNYSSTEPGIVVNGKIMDQSTKNPLANAIVFLSLQDSLIRLRYAISDTDGNFCFYLNGYHGEQTAYLTAFDYSELRQLTNIVFELDNNFLDEKGGSAGKIIGQKPARDTMTVLKSIVKKAYQQENLQYKAIPLRDTLPFENLFLAGNFSQTVYPGDYIKLKDFEEIAREILPLVRYKETREGFRLSLIDSKSDVVPENPVVFIDGVPTSDYSLLALLNTDKIKRIDVKSQPRAFGDILFENGMLFIWTKHNNFWSLNTQTYNPEVNIQCHQLPVDLILPDYSKNNPAKTPDFRHILYWNPSVSIKPGESINGTFYTSDEKGKFEIIMEGISNTGEPVYQQKIITIQ